MKPFSLKLYHHDGEIKDELRLYCYESEVMKYKRKPKPCSSLNKQIEWYSVIILV